MPTNSQILTLGRKLHNALRSAIEDPDHYESGKIQREDFEHYACGMYLAGSLAFIEGKYGHKSWEATSACMSLDAHLANFDATHRYHVCRISESGLAALVCIRNAIIHNDGDLSKNTDKHALNKVAHAHIPGVTISGSNVRLRSTSTEDFMEYVRLSFLAISSQQGAI